MGRQAPPGGYPGLATFPVLVVALHLPGALPAGAVLARYVTSAGESAQDPAGQTQPTSRLFVVDDREHHGRRADPAANAGDTAAAPELLSLPMSLLQASVELDRSPSNTIKSQQELLARSGAPALVEGHQGVLVALAVAAASCLVGVLLGFWWCRCCPKALFGGSLAAKGAIPTTPSGRQIEEPVKLVNNTLRLLWPAFSEMAMKAIIERAEPLVLQSLPPELQGQVAFDRAQCSLGSKPFQIPTARVCESRQAGGGAPGAPGAAGAAAAADLSLEAELEWEGDCSIVLSVAGVPMGIHQILLKACVFLELVGIRNTPELFQGVRVFLTSRPELTLSFQGLSRSVESVRPSVTRAIEEMISSWLLLPNVLGFPLSSQADIFSLIAPPPQGVLTLTARRTEAARSASFRASCGAQTFSSTAAEAEAEEVLEFHIHKAELQSIELKFSSESVVTGDGLKGTAHLRVDELLSWGGEEQTLDLSDGKPNSKAGQLRLTAVWRPLEPPGDGAAGAPPPRCCWLRLGLRGASAVPWAAAGEGAEFYLKVVCSHVTAPSKEEVLATLSRHSRLAAMQKKAGRLAVRQSPARRVQVGSERLQSLQQKAALLQKHRVPLDEAAQLTGLEPELLAGLMRAAEPSAAGAAVAAAAAAQGQRGFSFLGRRSPPREPAGDLAWDWPCHFLTDSPSQAELAVCLMRRGRAQQPLAAPPEDELLDSFTCSVADVLRAKHMTVSTVTTLPSTGIRVSYQLQARRCRAAPAAPAAAAAAAAAAAESSSDGASSTGRRP